jgi:hypothetical protein
VCLGREHRADTASVRPGSTKQLRMPTAPLIGSHHPIASGGWTPPLIHMSYLPSTTVLGGSLAPRDDQASRLTNLAKRCSRRVSQRVEPGCVDDKPITERPTRRSGESAAATPAPQYVRLGFRHGLDGPGLADGARRGRQIAEVWGLAPVLFGPDKAMPLQRDACRAQYRLPASFSANQMRFLV